MSKDGLGDSAPDDQQLLSVAEISRHLQLSRGQVREMVLAGAFGDFVRNAGGHFRVRKQRVLSLNAVPPKKQQPAMSRRRGVPSSSELFWLYDQDLS
jgi:hypothetical protein